MSSQLVTRRRVLAVLCAAGFLVGPGARAADVGTGCRASTLADGIDPSVIRELAAQYRARYPNEAGTKSVLVLLQDQASSPEAVVARLAKRVSADYGHDRTAELSGWHVSHTEAQLFCALGECLD